MSAGGRRVLGRGTHCHLSGTSQMLQSKQQCRGRREGSAEGGGWEPLRELEPCWSQPGLCVWSGTVCPAFYLTQQREEAKRLCFYDALIPSG